MEYLTWNYDQIQPHTEAWDNSGVQGERGSTDGGRKIQGRRRWMLCGRKRGFRESPSVVIEVVRGTVGGRK